MTWRRVLVVAVMAGCALGVVGCTSDKTSGDTGSEGDTQEVALLPVEVNGEWGFIDQTGQIVVEPRFNRAGPFSCGLACVQVDSDGFWGFIDRAGQMVVEPQFAGWSYFSDGLAAVQLDPDGAWGFIDKKGEMVIEPQFIWGESHPAPPWECEQAVVGIVYGFSDGLAMAKPSTDGGSEGPWGYIDKTGNWVIEPQFPMATEFHEGLADLTP